MRSKQCSNSTVTGETVNDIPVIGSTLSGCLNGGKGSVDLIAFPEKVWYNRTARKRKGAAIMKKTIRNEIFEYIGKKYGAEPEFPWQRYPSYAVFRHEDNKKWFALIMNISRDKLGLRSEEKTDVINLKLGDPLLTDLLIQEDGIFRGYHISRGNWISVLLDGTVKADRVRGLIDMSYTATASAEKKQAERPPKEWIIPANPKYYDIVNAFNDRDIIEWKQGRSIRTGDTVFMYVGAPVSAVLYKCSVTETGIPYGYSDSNITIDSLMRIKLVKRYPPELFTFGRLNDEFGIFAVRGPRGIPNSLSTALNEE